MRRKKRPSMDGLGDRSRSRRSAAGAGGGGGSELFICFTSLSSASSSSSMRASAAANAAASSSKSLLSPGRSRDASAAPSLSSSLSRRLRSSGSVKGAQSPMFPLVSGGSRRKGPAFEAAEPSSPKVTCIGQVRVRSKKKKKKKAAAAAAAAAAMRSRSMRGGEASFRRTSTDGFGGGGGEADEECLPNKNQRWVYELPVSICEALRNFGSEFSCFFPCGGKSFCSKTSSRSPDGADRGGGRYDSKGPKRSTSSCGGVIARWLMAIEEDEEEEVGRRVDAVSRKIEERRKEDRFEVTTALREEAFGYGYKEFEKEEKKEEVVVVDEAEEEEEARVSVCVPPPNALLLMRCRSDPVRMAALATRFWDSPAMKVHVQEGHGREKVDDEEESDMDEMREKVEEEQCEQDHKRSLAEVVDAKVVVTETMELLDQKEKSITGTIQGIVLVEEVKNESECKESYESALLQKQQNSNEVKLNEHLDLHEAAVAGFSEAHRRSSVDQEEVAAVKAESPEIQGKLEGILIPTEAHLVDGQEEEEVKGRRSSSCSATADKEEKKSIKCHSKAKDGVKRHSRVFREKDKRRHSFSTDTETRRPSFSNEKESRRASFSIEGKRRWSFCIDSEDLRLEKKALEEEKKKKKEHERSLEVKALEEKIDGLEAKVTPEEEAEAIKGEECCEELDNGEREGDRRRNWEPEEQKPMEKKSNELPDCLLLMMYEPKLSMEVSKETWVCSNDFLRWRPNYKPRQPSKGVSKNGGDGDSATVGAELANTKVEAKTKSNEEKCSDNKEAIALIEPAPQRALPPVPAPAPPAAAIEKKNPKGNVVALQAQVLPPAQATTPYGPFVLTRCKSEPMRSSARLTPDACFWKDRHRPIGAAGIGF